MSYKASGFGEVCSGNGVVIDDEVVLVVTVVDGLCCRSYRRLMGCIWIVRHGQSGRTKWSVSGERLIAGNIVETPRSDIWCKDL